MRQRAELVERSFAHILDRGGMRRTWLRGRENVHKRYLIHVAGHNLGLLMRLLIGAGTPKEAVARGWCLLVLLRTTDGATYAAILEVFVENSAGPALIVFTKDCTHRLDETTPSSTGCYATSKFAIGGFSGAPGQEVLDSPDIQICPTLPSVIDTP